VTVPPGTQATRLRARIAAALRSWMRRRRARLLVAGYAALILFAMTAGVTRWLAGATPRAALIAGAAVVAPLVFAYFGDRITGVKALGVEVSLAEVAVRVNVDVSSAVMIIAHTSGSEPSKLGSSFESVIRGRARMLQLDLQDDDYWWSTRLYLVASIAVDFTEVERLVHVASD
jgi:hypothetical protein